MLNLLVIEDLAMAVYLPIVGAVVAGKGAADTVTTIAVALAAVSVILMVALRWGHYLSRWLTPASDEALLLAVFGLTLLVGGLAEKVQVSAAIGAFLIGLALSGPVQARASSIVGPLRDLFAATFFLFFSFSVDPGDLVKVLAPRPRWRWSGSPAKSWPDGGRRVRSPLCRADFAPERCSLLAVSSPSSSPHSARPPPTARELGAMAAAYVLITAVLGPLVTKFSDRLAPVVEIKTASAR